MSDRNAFKADDDDPSTPEPSPPIPPAPRPPKPEPEPEPEPLPEPEPIPVDPASLVFSGYKAHCSGSRLSTELVMIEAIRSANPDYNVTCTSGAKADLIGFAAAGNAIAVFDDNDYNDLTRSYISPTSKTPKLPATLKNTVRFGRWTYTWGAKEYLVYKVEYSDPGSYKPAVKLWYVLAPKILSPKVIDDLLLAVGAFSTILHNEIYVFDDGMWCKDEELWQSVSEALWDDVILPPALKNNLLSDVLGFFDSKDLYKSLSVPWKRGLILHGVPGNGKTISIKALINILGKRAEPIPSLYVKSLDSMQGKKPSIRSIFSHARDLSPCLLIFEDLDTIVTEKTRSYFLNEVDGLSSNDGILMLGSTNYLENLDAAITKRPSRFDRKYYFQLPRLAEREAYARFWAKKLEGNPMVRWEKGLESVIARMTEGFSFAYLKELFIVSLLLIVRGGHIDDDEETVIVEHEAGKISETKKAQEVDIPENLRDNILLKVLKSQARSLLDEMDNSTEKEEVGVAGKGKAAEKMRSLIKKNLFVGGKEMD